MAIVLGIMLFLSTRGSDEDEVATTGTTPSSTTIPTGTTVPKVPAPPGPGAAITGETPCPADDGSAERTTTFAQAPPMCLEEGVDYVAVIETDRGQVQVALDTENAPGTANNFAVLARYHYYDNTALFRTDPSIDIIQGGSPHSNSPSDQGPGYTIQDEGSEFTYQPGDLVMARTGEPNSAGAQFFFGVGPNVANLDFNPAGQGTGTYVRFGRVISGLDLLQAVLASHVEDPTSGLGGYPSPPVVILSVTIVPAEEAPTPTTMAPATTSVPATTVAPASTLAPTTTAP
jgi:cyclophilin family peptidyl-prolyl cis-trans isomerase